jgi:hypothetical protein
MMRTLSLFLLALLLLAGLGAPEVRAQYQRHYIGISYNVSIPLGDTKDFAGDTSWRGATLEARWTVSDFFTFGGLIGWHVLNDRTAEPYDLDGLDIDELEGVGGTITGTQLRYLNTVPLLVTGHYYLNEGGLVRPYVGSGVGFYYAERRVDIGVRSFNDDGLYFGLAPEVGVAFPLGNVIGLVSGRYHVAFASPSITYAGINAGLAWRP